MKTPAFLFYVNDFDCDTKFFSDDQVGKYMRLWIAQFQHGHLTKNQVMFVIKTWDEAILEKFKIDDKGLYYSELLEDVITKRKKFISKQKDKATKRWQSHGNATAYATASIRDMPIIENENENEIKNRNEIIEGGMGGDFETEKKYFLNDDEWKYKLCSAKNISKNEIEQLMEIFITDIELKQDFKSNKKLKSHFTNWFNLKKKEHEKRNFNQYSKSSRGAQQLLELIRQERAAGL